MNQNKQIFVDFGAHKCPFYSNLEHLVANGPLAAEERCSMVAKSEANWVPLLVKERVLL